METRVTEVADGVHQLSTFIGAPVGFNQYLIAADEPLLFHTGMRQMFPLVSAGLSKIVAPETLRWVSFGHVEADECGSMNDWLAIASRATVAQSQIRCMVSIDDPPTGRRGRSPMARRSTSAATSSSGSTRPTCPTRGKRACSTTRPPRRCSAATSSHASATMKRRPATTSSARRCRPRTTRRVAVAAPLERRHHPATRGARRRDPRPHARARLHWRLPHRSDRPRRRLPRRIGALG